MYAIPPDWLRLCNEHAYFTTYYGDIYSGHLIECSECRDSFFILSQSLRRTFNNIQNPSLEDYRKYGWEIRDPKIIRGDIRIQESIGRDVPILNQSIPGNHRFKRMFIFGAAASSFCVFGSNAQSFRASHLNPPTGFEIFDEKYESLCIKYPGVQATIPLFEANGKDIEGCLEEEWQNYKYVYAPQMAIRHINVQYYLQDLFTEISRFVVSNYYRTNLYALLMSKIQALVSRQNIIDRNNEIVSLVSFNYDTILDTFAQNTFGFNIQGMNDYVRWDNKSVLLFKPHGSCNWGWKFDPTRINGNNQGTIAEALYTSKIEPWQIYYDLLGDIEDMIAYNCWGFEQRSCENGRSKFTINKNRIELISNDKTYFPALLLPYRDKDEFVMPYNHYNALDTVIDKIEELYLIGWKGNEELFNSRLKRANNLKKIVIVNPDSANVIEHLSKSLKLGNYDIRTVQNFEDFVLHKFDEMVIN